MTVRSTGTVVPAALPAAALEGLACDLDARPPGVPHFASVEGAIVGVRHEDCALVVDYRNAPDIAAALEQIVEAERDCCATIGWRLERARPGTPAEAQTRDTEDHVLRLWIEGTSEQLAAARLLFPPGK